jgi:hypothetical protein
MSEAGHPPVHVPFVTNIKIDSSRRRNVYRDQPTREQAYWSRLVGECSDPEATLRAWVGGWRPPGFATRGDVYEPPGIVTRAARQLRKPWHARVHAPDVSAEEQLRTVRRYKGVRD